MVPLLQYSIAVDRLRIAMVLILKKLPTNTTLENQDFEGRFVFGNLLPVCALALTAEPSKGTNVVGDHHEGRPCKIFFGSTSSFFFNVHLTKAGGDNLTRQPKPGSGLL